MAKQIKKEILLESGTNELEVMEFTISGRRFGINVAKIVEIMRYEPVIPMPNANPFIEGVFKPRGDIMTLFNLPIYLGLSESEDADHDIYIITNFNKTLTAFHVHTVEAIHRISWDKIEKPDPAIYGGDEGMATGIARVDDRLITIIDFEKILAEINPGTSIKVTDVDKLSERPIVTNPIMSIEDSPTLERMVQESLFKAGFQNIIACSNGQEAWDLLLNYKEMGGDIKQYVRCIITDIEMPRLDGLRLTKLIRDDPCMKDLPVIVFSSLISPEMDKKARAVGSTAQISKPDVISLIEAIDKYMLQDDENEK